MKRIKIISLLVILSEIGCQSPGTKNKLQETPKSLPDTSLNSTLKFNEPNPGKTIEVDTSRLSCYIDVTDKIYKIKIVAFVDTASQATLSKFISTHKNELSRHKVFIIASDDVKPSTMIDILDLLVLNDIKSYELIENGKMETE